MDNNTKPVTKSFKREPKSKTLPPQLQDPLLKTQSEIEKENFEKNTPYTCQFVQLEESQQIPEICAGSDYITNITLQVSNVSQRIKEDFPLIEKSIERADLETTDDTSLRRQLMNLQTQLKIEKEHHQKCQAECHGLQQVNSECEMRLKESDFLVETLQDQIKDQDEEIIRIKQQMEQKYMEYVESSDKKEAENLELQKHLEEVVQSFQKYLNEKDQIIQHLQSTIKQMKASQQLPQKSYLTLQLNHESVNQVVRGNYKSKQIQSSNKHHVTNEDVNNQDLIQDKSNGEENADPDSRYWSRDAEKIINESSLQLNSTPNSETDCIVDIADEEITVEQLSKAINHSYVNLKSQNPLQQYESHSDYKQTQ